MNKTLYHFSENPTITVFRSRQAKGRELEPPCVRAIDTPHAPLYWFPRDCPRITFWAGPDTTLEDRERFLGLGSAARVHVTESAWLARMRSVNLYVYSIVPGPFELHPEPGGLYVSRREVMPERCRPVGDLLERHAEAGTELRFTPSLWPLRRAVAGSSLLYSMVRLRNALPRP